MTTLDLFLKDLPNDLHLIFGHQKTPSSLYLCYSEEDFFKILNAFPEEQIVFRFFEKKPKEIQMEACFLTNLIGLKAGTLLNPPSFACYVD